MAEIKVPGEVIVAAYEEAAATYGAGAYVSKTEDDALGAGVEYAAPIIAAWARKQALEDMRERFLRVDLIVAGSLAGDDHDERFSFEQPTGECQCGVLWTREHQVREITTAMFATLAGEVGQASPVFDLIAHLRRQSAWSERTFGPGDRAAGVVDHLRKELREVEAAPGDLTEWIDVAILAFDGAWRSGASPEQIADALAAKQAKNEARQWPDWRTMPTDRAIEHVRDAEAVGDA